MRDPEELQVELQTIENTPEKYSHCSHMDLNDLPQSVSIDPMVIDAVNEFIVRRDMLAAQLRAEKRLMRGTRH